VTLGFRITEHRMVEDVEHVRPELQDSGLLDVRPLRNAQIQHRSRRSPNSVPAKVSVRSLGRIVDRIESLCRCSEQSRSGECIGIEVVVTGSAIERLRYARIKIGNWRNLIRSHEG